MRMFEILDKLNQQDTENKTAHLSLCPDVVAVNKNGSNGTVTMGVPGNVAQQLVLDGDKKALILLIIDREAFETIKTQGNG